MRISSSPNSPDSPPCGLSAATPMRGVATPKARSVLCERDRASMRSGPTMSTARRRLTWDVTRKVEKPGITFASP